MACKFLISLTILLLICIKCVVSVGETNDCQFSLNNQILTCANVHLKTANLEHLLRNQTQVLIMRDCDVLKLGPALHTPPFQQLNNYQLNGIKQLEIASFTFQKMTRVKYIKITDNHYPLINNNTFYGASDLELLNLNNNSIEFIDTDAFYRLGELVTLELTHNNFKKLNTNLFASLRNLKSLFLYHNNIELLADGSLNGLNHLNVLDLTYNRLTRIDARMFDHLKELTYLYLSSNQIETIEGMFQCDKIQFLYLQHNKLKRVDAVQFNSLPSLMDLDLSKNKIHDLSAVAFYNLTKLKNLNYKDNDLSGDVDLMFSGTKPFITK